jgi:hypothetical protein
MREKRRRGGASKIILRLSLLGILSAILLHSEL